MSDIGGIIMKRTLASIILFLLTVASAVAAVLVDSLGFRIAAAAVAVVLLCLLAATLKKEARFKSGRASIVIQGLCKKYSSKADYSIENINISGTAGEIIGILGHNGAGKSTTIKCITGMHPYESGRITVCGYDLKGDPINAKANFGYVSDEFTLFEKMTGYEYINFMADIYKVSKKERHRRLMMFQEIFALGDSVYKPISSYSHGMKQKVSFMGALIHEPKVFILDEPMVGLDPYTANQVKLFFKRHSERGNIVLFSSHNLDVVEKICDRVYIIDQGHILEEINLEDFRANGGDLEAYFLEVTHKVAKA